jgi:hypothetical protein
MSIICTKNYDIEKERKFADNDITCYRILTYSETDPVIFGEAIEVEHRPDRIEYGVNHFRRLHKRTRGWMAAYGSNWDNGQLFDCFKDLDDAKDAITIAFSVSLKKESLTIVKCTIPKGSEYYDGILLDQFRFGSHYGYGSSIIRYDEVVGTYESKEGGQ